MPSTSRRAAAAATCLLPCLALAADHPPVRLGLWEITRDQQASGAAAAAPAVSEDMLARLPPEARARLEASMAARAQSNGSSSHSVKQCITEKNLAHVFEREDRRDHKCTHTVVSRTATSMEMHLECKNLGPGGASSTGTFKWAVTTPESMQGSVDLVTTVAGHDLPMHSALTGKWLGADCGDVKPHDIDTK